MKHLGDITAIDWSKVEPVDVVTGGSPCQGLSVAGLRKGLADERSGLFMEQIRCVKELRKADEKRGRTAEFIRPRYMVWENVPGAFSSGTPKGADFAAVIEEIIKVAEPRAAVSVCVPNGGWTKSGCYYAEDGSWSIAWRVHDAQFWGVPQRRKRIALVADFGGLSAPEVLFERKGLRGYFAEGGTPWQGVAVDAEISACAANPAEHGRVSPRVLDNQQRTLTEADDRAGNCVIGVDEYNQCSTDHVAKAMTAVSSDYHHVPCVAYSFDSLASNSMKSKNPHSGCRPVEVAKTLDTTDPNPSKNQGGIAIIQPVVFDARGNGDGDTASTITGDHENRITDYTSVVVEEAPVYCLQGNGIDRADTAGCNGRGWNDEACYTLNTIDRPAVAYLASGKEAFGTLMANAGTKLWSGNQEAFSGDYHIVEECGHPVHYIVRRITPCEVERLQGYPDGWTDIGDWTDSKGKKRKAADAPRYKALGNSIALPFWKWLLKRISAQYERDATLGSLFDGIGGFPLCWEQINGKGTARWASEIEEFPIAVTKIRFPEVE